MDEEPLVWAMPRRQLYALQGFITKLDLAVLTAVAEDSWCATRTAIAADVDCKEVRMAVVILRRQNKSVEALVSNDSVLAFPADIGPDVSGLVGLKHLAKSHAETVCCSGVRSIEIVGYLNDDQDAALRRTFVLVYRAVVNEDVVAPEHMAWVQQKQIAVSKLDGLSSKVVSIIV